MRCILNLRSGTLGGSRALGKAFWRGGLEGGLRPGGAARGIGRRLFLSRESFRARRRLILILLLLLRGGGCGIFLILCFRAFGVFFL